MVTTPLWNDLAQPFGTRIDAFCRAHGAHLERSTLAHPWAQKEFALRIGTQHWTGRLIESATPRTRPTVSLPLEDWRQLRQLGANPVVGFARVETTAPHALPSLVSSTRAVEVAFDFAAFESRDGQRPAHYVSVHYPALSSWPSETALHDEVRAVLGYDPAHYWDDEHADQIYLRLSLEKCRPWQAFLLQHVFAPIRKTRRH